MYTVFFLPPSKHNRFNNLKHNKNRFKVGKGTDYSNRNTFYFFRLVLPSVHVNPPFFESIFYEKTTHLRLNACNYMLFSKLNKQDCCNNYVNLALLLIFPSLQCKYGRNFCFFEHSIKHSTHIRSNIRFTFDQTFDSTLNILKYIIMTLIIIGEFQQDKFDEKYTKMTKMISFFSRKNVKMINICPWETTSALSVISFQSVSRRGNALFFSLIESNLWHLNGFCL